MMELGQNQPIKQIRSEDEDDEDRISRLPDCSIVEILSRLPQTKHAIRTGTLSKRWKHVWHSVPNLKFKNYDDVSPAFFSSVDKTLTQRPQFKIKKFVLDTCYDRGFETRFNNWVRYAVNCNVEELNLTLRIVNRVNEFPLDQFVFVCSSFRDLKFSGCSFNPTGTVSWKNLRSLCISHGNLNEDLIKNVLSGSPVLETLVLDSCYGYRRLDITSKSVKTLVVSGYQNVRNVDFGENGFEINAPNILSLKIHDDVFMRKLVLLNVSSLVEAELDYWHGTSPECQETLKGLILKLRHVAVVKIGGYCCKVLNQLEAKGFTRPSNLKVPCSHIVLGDGLAGGEAS